MFLNSIIEAVDQAPPSFVYDLEYSTASGYFGFIVVLNSSQWTGFHTLERSLIDESAIPSCYVDWPQGTLVNSACASVS